MTLNAPDRPWSPADLPSITRAAPTEADDLLRVIHAAYAQYEHALDPPSGAHRETTASLMTRLRRGGAAMGRLGSVPVGCVFFEPRGDMLYLGRLAVVPAVRGRGIGGQLVAFVEQEAVAAGLSGITLGVRLQLPQNTAFYTKLGYTISGYGSHPGYAQPTYMTMEKRLSGALPSSSASHSVGASFTAKESS